MHGFLYLARWKYTNLWDENTIGVRKRLLIASNFIHYTIWKLLIFLTLGLSPRARSPIRPPPKSSTGPAFLVLTPVLATDPTDLKGYGEGPIPTSFVYVPNINWLLLIVSFVSIQGIIGKRRRSKPYVRFRSKQWWWTRNGQNTKNEFSGRPKPNGPWQIGRKWRSKTTVSQRWGYSRRTRHAINGPLQPQRLGQRFADEFWRTDCFVHEDNGYKNFDVPAFRANSDQKTTVQPRYRIRMQNVPGGPYRGQSYGNNELSTRSIQHRPKVRDAIREGQVSVESPMTRVVLKGRRQRGKAPLGA